MHKVSNLRKKIKHSVFFYLFNKSEGDIFSIKPQLHPQLIIPKAYTKISCLLEKRNKQTGIWLNSSPKPRSVQLENVKFSSSFKTLVTSDWICLHSVLDSTDGLFTTDV